MTFATRKPTRTVLPTMSDERRQQIREFDRLIEWYFPLAEHAQAKWVAWCVSGYSPLALAKHGEHGVGLFAIDPQVVGFDRHDGWLLHNPIRNVAAAHKLWREHGWEFWGLLPERVPAFAE